MSNWLELLTTFLANNAGLLFISAIIVAAGKIGQTFASKPKDRAPPTTTETVVVLIVAALATGLMIWAYRSLAE